MFDEGEVWEQPALLTLAAGLSSAPCPGWGRRGELLLQAPSCV